MTAFWTNIIKSLQSEPTVVLAIGFIFLLMIYFIPWLVATGRNTRNRAQVRVINIFLWLSFVGRVVALAMAVSPDVEEFKKEE